MPRHTTESELEQYFEEWLDTVFRNGTITRHRRDAMLRAMDSHLPDLVVSLNKQGHAKLGAGKAAVRLFLREGRDPKFGRFNWFEIERAKRKPQKRLRCFLGHRFLQPISDCLRMNLRHVLEPSNIKLEWSGRDMNASGFFDHLVSQIRRCDFCIFDNRLANERPNVYIEAGISYVLKKPFILADFHANRIGMPSDLKHLLNIPYRNYSELTEQLYFNLPVFLALTHLRT